jgi:tRNA 2-thiouridine synthesizing protein A
MPDKTLDVKGLACPLPVLKARKALLQLPKGATLEVLATDPAALRDFMAFSKSTGHALLDHSETGGVYRFLLQRSK